MKTLLKNARILTMKDDKIFFGHVIVKDNIIQEVATTLPTEKDFDKVIDCQNNLLMPGFKNAHGHSAMTFLRSKADDSSLQDWLFKEILPAEDKLHNGCVAEFTKVAVLEYLTSGITGCLDQYFFVKEFKKSCEDMGFRSRTVLMYDPASYTHESVRQVYKDMNDGGLSDTVIGMHAEYTSTPDKFDTDIKLLYETKSKFYVHLSETLTEVENCYAKYGMSPVELFNSRGFFDNGGAIFHGVYLSDKDMDILKEKNIIVVSCPASNMKLASGIAEIQKMLDKGITVALGTDGPASNNALDMFREMYLLTGLQKLANKNPVSIPAFEVLKMATVNGAIACGYDNAKYIEKGQLADIIMIDLTRPSMQPINNIISNLIYSGGKDIIKMTMIDGKILYMDGKFYIKEDINKIYENVQRLSDELNNSK